MILLVENKLLMFCLVLAYIRQVLTVIVLDQNDRGKPIWREASLYRDRSQIPTPSENDKRKLSQIRQDFYPIQVDQNTKSKKWKIGRIFYTLPIGATFPIFYTSTRGRKKGKKSEIFYPESIVKATFPDRNNGFEMND